MLPDTHLYCADSIVSKKYRYQIHLE